MKLLRDVFRLRAAGRSLLDRRVASRHDWTITVPAPLNTSVTMATIDMHWHREPGSERPVARWHRHVALKSSDPFPRVFA
ncbi:hypothetical protein [Luteibacter sp. UNCMF366Tsu5.1]|uniref:hypothetical protein n=1 Tax=Luteibacter sp. UNCMF366Tsu5.1 TaxID=1502758 RepID=UPI000908D94A|nr:hypothetical protein [Luteibacter sp. UNCMF366Tsu5.1]SFW25124.1 hypothetical protein SAMN02800691_0539 [Luteibacter sp. UNCMF366Tsu5.1]